MKRIISFPRMGEYSNIFKNFFEELGFKVLLPPETSEKTIKFGCKHSSDMMCLTGNSKITINDYTQKKIKDIKVGDKVLTHKGRFRKVIKLFSREYSGKILEIDCGGLLKFDITPEHPVYSLKNNDIGFNQVNKLEKGDFIIIPKPTEIKDKKIFEWNKKYEYPLKYNFNKIRLSKDVLRMIGYYLAEGSIIYNRRKTKQTAGLSFVFSSKEREYINDILNIIKNNIECSISTRNQKPSVSEILIYNKILSDIFLYLCGEYCNKKRISKELMYLKPNLQLEIVKGFLRGDGHLDKNNHYSCATISEDLANQLFWILIRNDIKPSFFTGKQKNRYKCYKFKIFDKLDINKIDNLKIKAIRKPVPKYKKKKDYMLVPIKNIIKKDFKGKVYNLEVEEDHSYVANFLAVHNCYPFKVTLGNFWEALELGANTLLMWDSKGRCRFRHYHIIHEYTLKNLGYEFEMYPLHINFISTLKKINSDLTVYKILKVARKYYNKIKKIEEKNILKKDEINIGIIGEIYTCLASEINYDIINKIKKIGVNVYNTIAISDFLKDGLKNKLKLNFIGKNKYKREAEKYLNGPLGGHGFENIYNLLLLHDKGIDGVVHMMPLSCMPESTVEPIINNICVKKNIPLLRLPIDETNSEANVNTRLETFIELIKRKKK